MTPRTLAFELNRDEVEALLAFHYSGDEEDWDLDAIDELENGCVALGGDPNAVHDAVVIADEDDEDEDAKIEIIADLIGALVEGQEVQTDAILKLTERVEDIEEGHEVHAESILRLEERCDVFNAFHEGHGERLEKIERRRK